MCLTSRQCLQTNLAILRKLPIVQNTVKYQGYHIVLPKGAVAGLADQPLQASQEALNSNSSVSIAVIKGLGKGLIGAFTKPLSGTAELLAQTGRGLLNTTGIAVNRFHSELIQFTLTSRSELLIDVNQFMTFGQPDDQSRDRRSPTLFWSSMAVNGDQRPVYLFLSSASLIEWSLDGALGNRRTVYALANYHISICSHVSFRHCLRLQFVDTQHEGPLLFSQQFSTVDNRINAFISELQYARDSGGDPAQRNSRTSSTNSTDYVKFTPLPNALGIDASCIYGDNAVRVVEDVQFYSHQSLDGIMDALAFLNCERSQSV